MESVKPRADFTCPASERPRQLDWLVPWQGSKRSRERARSPTQEGSGFNRPQADSPSPPQSVHQPSSGSQRGTRWGRVRDPDPSAPGNLCNGDNLAMGSHPELCAGWLARRGGPLAHQLGCGGPAGRPHKCLGTRKPFCTCWGGSETPEPEATGPPTPAGSAVPCCHPVRQEEATWQPAVSAGDESAQR